MSKRAVVLALVVSIAAWGLLTGCSTREEYVASRIEEAGECAQRRDYGRAQAVLDDARGHAPREFELLMEKADIYMRAHDFAEAAAWSRKAASVDPASPDALVGEWRAEFAADNESEAARARIRGEADALLVAAPDSIRSLTAAIQAYTLIGLDDEISEARERLVTLYPESELGSELIKEDIDWIGVERDDEKRLEMADEFFESYPVTEWTPEVMRLKLVTLKRLERPEDVLSFGRAWAAEHPDDPEVLNLVASAFVSSRLAPDEAVELARRAVEIQLARCEEAAPEEDGAEDLAKYSLTAARALVLARNFPSAMEAAAEALDRLDLDADDEETGAAYRFTLGQALEGLERYEDAFDAYVKALVAGGRKNWWPARADTALTLLFEREFAAGWDAVSAVELARARRRYTGPVFTDVTAPAGLDGRGESRLAWGDYDGDGYDDLLLSGRVLMRNLGDGSFADVTEGAGIGGTRTNGAVWADIDNDGDLDFYATSGATQGERTDRLWVNRGDGTFEDGTEAAGGMTDLYTTEGAAWGDMDGDGFVDLYLASYERPQDETFDEYGVGYPDILYRNMGDGTFVDVTPDAGIEPPFGEHLSGRGVSWGDYDNDGDLDIFVSNYRLQENFLWRNHGDGTFTNVAAEVGVSGTETDGWWGHTIGSEWGDCDNDGDLDLVCANLAHPRYIEVSDMSMLYRNVLDSGRRFVERRADAGIKFAETHSDPSWGDVDADGDLDLFITSIYSDCGTFLYLNDGAANFEDVTWLAGVRSMNGWGCGMSDYDQDGDLDIAVASGSGFHLFRNDGPACGDRAKPDHWLAVRAVGTGSNAAGIGARIIVRGGARIQMREVQGGKGTTSQHSLTAFFGLGRRGRPVDVELRFLGGETVRLADVAVDQLISVVEPK